jgi:hypothetical protein
MYEGGAKRERRGAAKEIHRFLHTIDVLVDYARDINDSLSLKLGIKLGL